MTATATITYEPTDVRVADERDLVAGAKCTVSHPGHATVTVEVIPKEGPSPDCWLGHSGIELDEELWDALAEAAAEGARGESGSIEVDLD